MKKFVRETVGIILLPFCLGFFLAAFGAGCTALTPVLGPADSEISEQEQLVDSLPADSPERAAAEKKLADLKSDRKSVDDTVETASGFLNIALPGSGVLLSLGYAWLQRSRKKKASQIVESTFQAIDEFRAAGGGEAVGTLLGLLEKNHNAAGIRAAVKESMAKLDLKTTSQRQGP